MSKAKTIKNLLGQQFNRHITSAVRTSSPLCRINILSVNVISCRPFSLNNKLLSDSKDGSGQISEEVREPVGALTTGQKVKQAGKDVTYFGIMLFGFAVTGSLVWYVVSELLFSFSPTKVFSEALELVKLDPRVAAALGDGLKGYGEDSGRGRRCNVSYQEYIVDNVNHMRVQFYISGKDMKATVHCEAKETSRGKFDFRYVFVELDTWPPSKPIIVLDNR